MNLEKIVVRTTAGGLLSGAICVGLGRLLGAPLLVSLGKYIWIAAVALGSIVPLAAIVAVGVTRERRR
jgi:membrane protein DedA with SNARE-associated domain